MATRTRKRSTSSTTSPATSHELPADLPRAGSTSAEPLAPAADVSETFAKPRTAAQRAVAATLALGEPLKVETLPAAAQRHEFAPTSTATPNDGGLAAALASLASSDASAKPNAAAAALDAKPLSPAEQAAQAMQADPVGAAVSTAQMLFTLSVSLVAKVQKVELTPEEFERIAKFSPQELSTLRALAPAAAPYIIRGLEKAPLLGALAFGGAIVLPMAQRFGEIKRIRAARPPKPKTAPPKTEPPKSATEAALATPAPAKVPAAATSNAAGKSQAPAS